MNDDRRVIVIGSGPSGAMAALTLLREGIPVTMLESGSRAPSGLLVRLMGRNILRVRPNMEPRKHHLVSADPDTQWFHALEPGGLSNYWTGAVPRFAPEDFFEGERLHERYRWPISYEDLVPYYERVERLLDVVGDAESVPNLPAAQVAHRRRLPKDWQRLATQARRFGQGFTSLPIADGPPWLVKRGGTAFNSYTGIVRMLQRCPQFELRLGAHALQLEWCGRRKRVGSVIYFDRKTGSERRLGGAAVVVAGGPLASTKLLLQSASADFPNGLGNTEGLLGRYLHDHPHDMCDIDIDTPIARLVQAAYLTRAPYDESPPLLAASCTLGTSTSKLDKALTFTPGKTKSFGAIIFGSMIPVRENYVALDPSVTDDFGLPALDIHIRYGEQEPRVTAAARDRLLDILQSAGYRGSVRWTLPRLTPGSAAHFGGTVRMHQSPKYGMTNGWNRLHAVPNVVVADASCFTTGVEKNPTLTAMALASRASCKLAHDLKTSCSAVDGG